MKDEAGAREEIVRHLREAAKYRHLSGETLRRVADWAALRHPAPRDAIKAAKRKLHQVCGAYLARADFARVGELTRTLSPSSPEDTLRAACRKVLAFHASTAERIPLLEEVFPALFRVTGPPGSVLDLACGLNPFALPWMGLPPGTAYRALDVDRRLVSAVNDFFVRMGRPPDAGCRDLLVSPVEEEVDVALAFKILPCLEQQEKGAGERLLRGLRARCAVVSFPARTLGGRDRGMGPHYDRFMARTAEGLGIAVRKVAYPNEVFYVCDLKRQR